MCVCVCVCVYVCMIKPLALPSQLLESFENQLSTMRRDIESKDRMLNMYETSMADLSSKVHLLRKNLEEKVGTYWKCMVDCSAIVGFNWYHMVCRFILQCSCASVGRT